MIIIELINASKRPFAIAEGLFSWPPMQGDSTLILHQRLEQNLSGLDPTPGTIGITLSL